MWFLLTYLVIAIFICGTLRKLYRYIKTPAPLKIVLTPGPTTSAGVVVRMLKEVFLFRSLAKGDKVLWAAGWVFHVCLFLIAMRHLRYFFYPVPFLVTLFQQLGIIAGFVMPVALIVLLMRRLANERVRYVSSTADLLILLHLILIAATGLLMKFSVRQNIVDIKEFTLGIVSFHYTDLATGNWLFELHLALVLLLGLYFPFSKLLHSWGMLFSPSRHQADNPIEERHLY